MYDQSFIDTLKITILKNKKLLYLTIFITILCFGFTITNFSIGVDDPARMHYLYSNNIGNMIQQGRLIHIILNKLTGLVDFIPFFNEFLGATLFGTSALLFCGLFQYISKNRFNTLCLTAFACSYISFPLITEKFIYSLDVIVTMLSYCTCVIALLYAYKFCHTHKPLFFLNSVIFLIISISSYESFVFLYITGVFAILCTESINDKDKITLKKFFTIGLTYAAILLISMLIYYALVFSLQLITHQYGAFSRSSGWENIRNDGVLYTVIRILGKIAVPIIFGQNISFIIFLISSILGFILIFAFSIKRKNSIIFFSYFFMWLSTFSISILIGYFQPRTLQSFCLFISFTLMLFIDICVTKHWHQILAVILVSTLTLLQSAEMNRCFYNDYKRFKKEMFTVNYVATDLMKCNDISKPVIFVKEDYNPNFNLQDTDGLKTYNNLVNGRSVINGSINVFGDKTSPIMFELFSMQGYDFFVRPTEEEAILGYEYSANQPCFPNNGYIHEFEEFIVVKF